MRVHDILIALAVLAGMEVKAQTNTFPTSGFAGIGTTSPAYHLHIINPSSGGPAVIGLRSSYSGTADSYIGDFGDYGTILANNKHPSDNVYTNSAAAPNQYKAVAISIGGYNNPYMFSVDNYPSGNLTERLVVDWNGNTGIGLHAPVSKLDIVTGVGDGSVNEANCLRLRHSGTAGNSQLLQLGVSNVAAGGANNGYGYISSVYWGGSENNPLILNPKGGPVGIGLTSGVNWSATVNGTVAVRAPSFSANNTLMGKLVFAHGANYGGQSSFIAGVYDKGYFASGAGIVFHTVSGSDISGVDGVERMRISSDGNVGIGTSNPLAPLHVNGGITANNGASVIYDKGNMSNQFYCSFYGNSLQQAFVGTPANVSNRLDLGTGNTTIAMTLLNNNIGIGTTNPACRLHVSGGTLAASSDDALSGFVQLWADNAIIWKNNNQQHALRFGWANDLSAGNWSEKMRITDAGYVGIGTLNPTEALEVAGNIKSAGIVLPTGAGAGKVLTSDANGVASWQTVSSSSSSGWALNGSTVGVLKSIGTIDNYDLPIITNSTERMRILANGGVAIGTGSLPASDALLAVKGNIYAQKVKVTVTGWSDYVFDPGYKLRPLNEVENYIQQQHHLPEVPSAKEVEKDGLDVGDNQATLLKKIEELTLYVIEQNKKQQQLDQRVNALQEENKQLKELLENSLKRKVEQPNKELAK